MSVTPHLPPLARIEQKTLVDLLVRGRRIDERRADEFREIKVEPGIIEKASGSSQVSLGKTKVMVGVKIETGEPFTDTPNEGVLTVNAELVPLASPSFEPGPPGENSIELARVVDRGIRESKSIELRKLCIVPGRKVFVIFVDVYVLDHDGNLIDAAAMAALSALVNSRMHEFDVVDGELNLKETTTPLPLVNYPVAVTTCKIDSTMIVDPCLEEEQVISARLTATVDKAGGICAMQKGGLGVFAPDEVKKAVELSIQRAEEIRSKILSVN